MKLHTLRIVAILSVFGLITLGAFYLASIIESNQALQKSISGLGLLGPILVAFVTGLNAVVPLPPATFAPLFISLGISVQVLILCFVIGTTIADSVGYLIGWLGRSYSSDHYPKITERFNRFFANHEKWILPSTYLYFAFAPLPNELIMIPLALVGYKYRHLIIPLIIGNIVHQSWMVLGYDFFFQWVF